jgi:hypothetical protein
MAEPRRRDRVREVSRMLHGCIHTEVAHMQWVRRFVLFPGKRHPLAMGEAEVEACLTPLAVNGRVVHAGPGEERLAVP